MTKIVKRAGRGRYAANKAKHDQRTPFGGGRDVREQHDRILQEAARRPNFSQLANESPWDIFEWREAWSVLGEPDLWGTLLDLTKVTGDSPTETARKLVTLRG